ncbi:rhomboid-like protein 14, mitochondrial [Iris pallida]|uniref:Rhomboid-like protein 14, mitochondrial n=1 Tax=Iris pallida TaxID=29817 RepID=A0AAX6DFD7_IRIPA|nr:rhomboid-like protein 14, mitochondrial [Iris pallida]
MDDYFGSVGKGRMLPLLAIQVASEYHRAGMKPPVTSALLAANTLIYFRPGPLDRLLPTVTRAAFSPHLILKYGDFKRFFLSPFYHIDETHLVYNMMSLVWKGVQLESAMDSVDFASMVASLLCLSQGITLILAKSSLLLFDYKTPYYRQLGIGFSGILFAMKVVINSQSDGLTPVFGVEILSRHAAWVELILTYILVPSSSFLGHLGGILAGLLYLQLRKFSSGFDPLAFLIRNVVGAATWPLRFIQKLFQSRRRRISGRGTVGRNQPPRLASGVWRCPLCAFDNTGWADVCERCSTQQIGVSASSSVQSPNPSGELDVDEVRLRRLARFEG